MISLFDPIMWIIPIVVSLWILWERYIEAKREQQQVINDTKIEWFPLVVISFLPTFLVYIGFGVIVEAIRLWTSLYQ